MAARVDGTFPWLNYGRVYLNVISAVKSVAIIIDDNENLWVNDVWNLAFASRSLFEDFVVRRPSVPLLHPIRFHVGEVTEAFIHFMVITAFEDDVVNASIIGGRDVEWNWSDH